MEFDSAWKTQQTNERKINQLMTSHLVNSVSQFHFPDWTRRKKNETELLNLFYLIELTDSLACKLLSFPCRLNCLSLPFLLSPIDSWTVTKAETPDEWDSTRNLFLQARGNAEGKTIDEWKSQHYRWMRQNELNYWTRERLFSDPFLLSFFDWLSSS